MMNFVIEPLIKAPCPDVQIGVVMATVHNSPTGDALWGELETEAARIKSAYELLEINHRPAIAATRRLYRALGKDPGRYRVASEQLCRRVIRGLGLYRLTTLIDLVNLVSMASGYPISGLDADKVAGDTLRMGVGREGEIYNGIGRGALNIAGLPVWRDALGPIATPTSDEERTCFSPDTNHVLICINAFGTEMPLPEAINLTVRLLTDYAAATNLFTTIIKP